MDMLNILTQAPYYSGCLSIGIYLESILAFKLQNIRYSFKNLCYFKIFHLKIPFCKWTQINAEMSFRALRFCHSERSEESYSFAQGRLREESDTKCHPEQSEGSYLVPSLTLRTSFGLCPQNDSSAVFCKNLCPIKKGIKFDISLLP